MLAPLPILIAALGWSHWAALVAAPIGAARPRRGRAWHFLAAFLFGVGLPAWWLGYLALLARPGATPRRHRNGIRSVGWCCGRRHRHAFIVVRHAAELRHRQGRPSERRARERPGGRAVGAAPLESPDDAGRLDRHDGAEISCRASPRPAHDAHQCLQSVARRPDREVSGRLRRPWPRLPDLQLPLLAPAVLGAAVAGSFLPDSDRRLVERPGGEPADRPCAARASPSCTPHPRAERAAASFSGAPMRPSLDLRLADPLAARCSSGLADITVAMFDLRGRSRAGADRRPRRSDLIPPDTQSTRWRRDRWKLSCLNGRQAWPDGRCGARQGRLRAQLSLAQGQGAAGQRSKPLALRDHEGRPRGAQSAAARRGREGRREAQWPELHGAQPGGRRRPALRLGHRRATWSG